MSWRPAVRQRLAAGFLAGVPATVRELAAMLEGAEPEASDAAGQALRRLADTARSLDLGALSDAAVTSLASVAAGGGRPALDPLVRAVGELRLSGPFAPIGVLAPARALAALRTADDGSAEPLRGYETADALRRGLAVEWPQAVVLPASLGVRELRALAGSTPLFAYGPSRDDEGRAVAVEAGAVGYLSEPLTWAAIASQVRWLSVARRPRPVALAGPEGWAEAAGSELAAAGVRSVRADGLSASVHGIWPAAVVLGPGSEPGAVRRVRQHLGRSHVALLAVVDADPEPWFEAGVDDVVRPGEPLAPRVAARLRRAADHRRDRDELTGLLDRPALLEAMHRWMAWTARTGVPLAACLLLVEGLSEVEARFGPEPPNSARRQLAAALERGLRRHDLVGRIGQDLFLVILTNCRSADADRRMAEVRVAWHARLAADRRLGEAVLHAGASDTTGGVPGLLARALVALDAKRAEA